MNARTTVGAMLSALLLAMVSATSATTPAAAAVLDPNWTESPWFTAPSSITGMAWAPDGSGRLFVTRKTGEIRIINAGPPPALVATPFATVSPVTTSSECGLIGIVFDPNFVSNGYVYVLVTVSSTEQQIVRYTASGNLGLNKTVVIPGLPTIGANHDGGGIGIGRDGKLYWSVGDNGSGVGVDADLMLLASKVGRATRQGAVPADNPFIDGPGGNNDYIYARGFRNPFTLTFQPTTGMLWVDVTGGGYEQVFAVAAADHAGWNDYENNQPAGFITPVIKYKTNTTDTRNLAGAGGAVRNGNVVTFTTTATHGFRQGELITIAGVGDASFNGAFYVASIPTATTFTVAQAAANASSGGGTATTQFQGGALTGGAFYDASGAPAAYRGNFFYGDYNSGRVMRAVVGPGTTVTSVDYFVTGNNSSIDVSVGPDGALYYVGHGGAIFRTAYNASAQGIIVSRGHVWMDEGGKGVFTVRLALAPSGDVTVATARTAGSDSVDVTGGGLLTFTPANFAVPQAVTLQAVLGTGTDAATFSVSSAGLAIESVEANVMKRAIFAYGSPGRVPDVLTLRKNATNPTELDLDWSPSCGAGSDYSVHQGTIGSWYSHTRLLCSTNGATAATVGPGAASQYYLVVPLDATREGSYGTASSGVERPRSTLVCRPGSDSTSCP